jgi:hypothetical protein
MRRGRGGKGSELWGGEAVLKMLGLGGGGGWFFASYATLVPWLPAGSRLWEGSAMADLGGPCAPRYKSIELTFQSITESTGIVCAPSELVPDGEPEYPSEPRI